MNSVISQQQLNMLLDDMHDSIPKKSVLKALNFGKNFDIVEKNEAYHKILSLIKSSDSKVAATSILEYIQDIISERLTLVSQTIDLSNGDGITVDGNPTTGIGSKIFRRVG